MQPCWTPLPMLNHYVYHRQFWQLFLDLYTVICIQASGSFLCTIELKCCWKIFKRILLTWEDCTNNLSRLWCWIFVRIEMKTTSMFSRLVGTELSLPLLIPDIAVLLTSHQSWSFVFWQMFHSPIYLFQQVVQLQHVKCSTGLVLCSLVGTQFFHVFPLPLLDFVLVTEFCAVFVFYLSLSHIRWRSKLLNLIEDRLGAIIWFLVQNMLLEMFWTMMMLLNNLNLFLTLTAYWGGIFSMLNFSSLVFLLIWHNLSLTLVTSSWWPGKAITIIIKLFNFGLHRM